MFQWGFKRGKKRKVQQKPVPKGKLDFVYGYSSREKISAHEGNLNSEGREVATSRGPRLSIKIS